MAAENASNTENVHTGNGSVPKPETPKSNVPDSILVTIALTIYDVIVFLAVSIGYIFQVSKQMQK